MGDHITGEGSGAIGIVSQSGGLGMRTGQVSPAYGVPASHLLFPGNSIDVDALDLANYLLECDSTRVVVLIIEALPHRERLEAIGRRSAAVGKPVVVYKLGKSELGARAALSHTGSLAGENRAATAVLRRAGLIEVQEFEDLLETAKFFETARVKRARRVAVVTSTGGAAVLACDTVASSGVVLPSLSDSTLEELKGIVPDFGVVGNPVDVTATEGIVERQVRAVQIVAQDPNIDTILVPLSPTPKSAERPRLLREAASTVDKNVSFYWMTQWAEGPGTELIRGPGVSLFRSLSRAYRAFDAWDSWNEQIGGPAPTTDGVDWPARAAVESVLSQLETSEKRGPHSLNEVDSSALLEAAGLTLTSSCVVHNAEDAVAFSERLSSPIVLKILSAEVPHKSDVGGVLPDLRDRDSITSAYQSLMQRISQLDPQIRVDGVLASEMVEAGHEMFIGAKKDPAAGPLVMCGWGGTQVGVLVDPVIEAAPVNLDIALQMIDRLRGSALLAGYRGAPPADTEAFANAVVAVSRLIVTRPTISEIDINPIFVLNASDGVKAADALVVLE